MQVERHREETSRLPAEPEKRRIRTEVWHLKRRAERRRRRANAIVVGSVVALGVLVRCLYALLAS
ncbi:MAG TPA: hypothetical protein VHL80_03345 [Polyangia bacterium]|nr:hypothetical protein [Polyangia bacterium]